MFRLLPKATHIVTIVTSLSLLLSIIYNSLFFSVFDINLLFSLSLSDHVTTGITFLPQSVVLFTIGFFIARIISSENISSEDEKKSKFVSGPQVIHVVVLILLVQWVFYGDAKSPIVYAFIWLIVGAHAISFFNKKFGMRVPKNACFTLFMLILFFLVISFSGYNDAKMAIKKPIEIIVTDYDNKENKYSYIRQIDKGLFVYKDEMITFLPISSVSSYSIANISDEYKSHSCKLFNVCL